MRSRSSIRAVRGPDDPEWHRDERPRPHYDRALADQLLADSLTAVHLEPVGTCWDCSRPVSGERLYCGPCLAGH